MKKPNKAKHVEQEFIQRLSLQFRVQHIVLSVSTLVLIFTGTPMLFFLKKPEGIRLSQNAVLAFGNLEIIRTLHYAAGLVLAAISVYHVLYTVLTREGRREFINLLPRLKDVTDVTANVLYFLHLRKEKPQFERYTYFEKFDTEPVLLCFFYLAEIISIGQCE